MDFNYFQSVVRRLEACVRMKNGLVGWLVKMRSTKCAFKHTPVCVLCNMYAIQKPYHIKWNDKQKFYFNSLSLSSLINWLWRERIYLCLRVCAYAPILYACIVDAIDVTDWCGMQFQQPAFFPLYIQIVKWWIKSFALLVSPCSVRLIWVSRSFSLLHWLTPSHSIRAHHWCAHQMCILLRLWFFSASHTIFHFFFSRPPITSNLHTLF